VISGLGMLLGSTLIPAHTNAEESFHASGPISSADEISKSVRNTKVLSDNWRFQVDIKNIGDEEQWFKSDFPKNNWSKLTTVPQAWDCYQDALWEYEGVGWYATTISPNDFTMGKRVAIVFNRVMYYSKVWLNGKYLGENIGGYLPFNFDITSHLKSGQENRLVLRVDNKPRIEWLPAGKQIEWIQYGGILGKVEIVSQSHVYIDDATIQTNPGEGPAQINCHVTIVNDTDAKSEQELDVQVVRGNVRVGKNVKVVCIPNQKSKVSVHLAVANAELWSPDSPALYKAEVSLKKSGVTTDNLIETFGIRQVTVEGETILLNGKPIRIKGVNRYDDYDRYGPNVPEKLLREELALMKSVGINFIRMHYPQSPDMLSLYD
jgi:beta-galactosidase/beta-glucuronidase